MGDVIDIRTARPLPKSKQKFHATHPSTSEDVRRKLRVPTRVARCLEQLPLGKKFSIVRPISSTFSFQKGDLILEFKLGKESLTKADLDEWLKNKRLPPEQNQKWICLTPKLFVTNIDTPTLPRGEPQKIVVLRPKEPDDSQLCLQFFTMGTGLFQPSLVNWFEKSTSAISEEGALNLLRNIEVPVLPQSLVDGVQSSLYAGERLSEELSSESDFGDELLTIASPADVERSVARLHAQSYAFLHAVDAIKNTDYLISKFFPFPIACAYRSLFGTGRSEDFLDRVASLTENTLAFLGSLALALHDSAPAGAKKIFFDEEHLGLTLGTWSSLLESALKNEGGTKRVSFLDIFARHCGSRGFRRSTQKLVQMRNRNAHGGEDEDEVVLAKHAQTLVEQCMNELMFLVRYPLFRILEVSVDRLNGPIHLVQDYSGDHPAHEERYFQFREALPEGAYIQLEERPKDLYPFILVRKCEKCLIDETFHLDKRGKSATEWIFKSFERGHRFGPMDLGESLGRWLDDSNSQA